MKIKKPFRTINMAFVEADKPSKMNVFYDCLMTVMRANKCSKIKNNHFRQLTALMNAET